MISGTQSGKVVDCAFQVQALEGGTEETASDSQFA